MQANAFEWHETAYVGGDFQSRHMKFKQGYSTGIDKNRYLQGNVYLGLNCNPFFGFELGFENSSKQSAMPYLPLEAPYAGQDITAIDGAAIKTKTTLRGYHAGLVSFLPLNAPFDLKLVALLGMANLKTKVTSDDYDIDLAEWRYLTFKKKVWTPRIGMGAQTMINEHFGLRAMVIWEKTSKFGYILASEYNRFKLAPKNSVTPSIGLFYKF